MTGHDIRMKEFKRAFLRGYSADEVDTFLMHLAVEIDRSERYYRVAELDPDLPVPPKSETAELDETLFPSTTAEVAEATAGPDEPDRLVDAQRQAETILAEATATAEQRIERAEEDAREIVASAKERQQEAERAEAAASLRLSGLEQRIAGRVAALSAEVQRLEELAGMLAEHDLAPALEELHTPAHAAPADDANVVPLARTADE